MEQLKHECGVAMIRLLKPLDYYEQKYGTVQYPLNKLYLLMEKQHNRGQEGAGLACVRLSAKPGDEYMFRERAAGTSAITEIFNKVYEQQARTPEPTARRTETLTVLYESISLLTQSNPIKKAPMKTCSWGLCSWQFLLQTHIFKKLCNRVFLITNSLRFA